MISMGLVSLRLSWGSKEFLGMMEIGLGKETGFSGVISIKNGLVAVMGLMGLRPVSLNLSVNLRVKT